MPPELRWPPPSRTCRAQFVDDSLAHMHRAVLLPLPWAIRTPVQVLDVPRERRATSVAGLVEGPSPDQPPGLQAFPQSATCACCSSPLGHAVEPSKEPHRRAAEPVDESGVVRGIELEAWALRVLDSVRARGHNEDSRVELKRDWPGDAARAARRIAGQANAARGDDILWLIGVDESNGLVGASAADTASWWRAVASHFDETPPLLQDQVVHVEGRSIVALLFDTALAPFVVKNSSHGQPGGGPVEREVPWRDGTSVRSARRSDLVRLLVPRLNEPEFEVLAAWVHPSFTPSTPRVHWSANVRVYSHGQPGESLTIPDHQVSMVLRLPGRELPLTPRVQAQEGSAGGIRPRSAAPESVARTIRTGVDQVLIEGPGPLTFSGFASTEEVREDLPVQVAAGLLIEWRAVGGLRSRRLDLTLPWRDFENGGGRWELQEAPDHD